MRGSFHFSESLVKRHVFRLQLAKSYLHNTSDGFGDLLISLDSLEEFIEGFLGIDFILFGQEYIEFFNKPIKDSLLLIDLATIPLDRPIPLLLLPIQEARPTIDLLHHPIHPLHKLPIILQLALERVANREE